MKIPALILALCALPWTALGEGRQSPVDWVNPNIGGISQLLVPTFPTTSLPNGMLRVYPQRESFATSHLDGLPLAVTSHRGGSPLRISPFVGRETSAVRKYSYDLEKVRPYRYDVRLDEEGVDVSFAPTARAAVYRFDFERDGSRGVALNAPEGELRLDGSVVTGYQSAGNRARVYIAMEFSAPPEPVSPGHSLVLRFAPNLKRLSVRYAISFIDADQAKRNLAREMPGFDVDAIAAKGREIWNKALGKVQVRGADVNSTTAFYTALYRTLERMVCVSEDGRYFSGFDNKVHADGGTPFYTDDWTWDTFRAAHPLDVILDPAKESAIVGSFVRMAGESPEGWMPTFPGIMGDQHCMNGNHYVSVVWDAYQKGVRGFDLATAYEACKRTVLGSTMAPWVRGPAGPLDAFYIEKGYFPALHPGEKETVPGIHGWEKRQAVPVTLAGAYDAWCLAQMAKALGRMDDYATFSRRALNYRNIFNPATGFFHPKDSEGAFIEPLDYRWDGGPGARDYYDENNGWTYRWDVQHNVADLVRLMGGRERFVSALDATFNEPLGKARYEFYEQMPDQTGNVGQFSMGNEPSLHIPYLYNYAGAPWKTQKRVRELLETWFRNDLQGVPGDEDGGGLSAFVVFSSLGFYPVTPGTGTYNIGSPIFQHASLRLPNGRTFTIDAKGCSHDAKYIQSARLNGHPLDRPWFTHSDLLAGGTLELVMGERPNPRWGSAPGAQPPSMSRD